MRGARADKDPGRYPCVIRECVLGHARAAAASLVGLSRALIESNDRHASCMDNAVLEKCGMPYSCVACLFDEIA